MSFWKITELIFKHIEGRLLGLTDHCSKKSFAFSYVLTHIVWSGIELDLLHSKVFDCCRQSLGLGPAPKHRTKKMQSWALGGYILGLWDWRGIYENECFHVGTVHEKYFLAEQKRILSFPHNLVLSLQAPHLFPWVEYSFEALLANDQVICG